MLLYVVTYDIPCDKRRKKVADLLEGYGRRVQYSVFECVLTAEKYGELRLNVDGMAAVTVAAPGLCADG
ncbi:CRISPR-associated endonuclease Cas2 [Pantanalinema rosaneae CENA516]|uniref:CRISPR-associated endonuclease Cas2 n=1 Tax=Pantanalinema rosaneae TaxID=1620701 RepID=UPI003D6FECF0